MHFFTEVCKLLHLHYFYQLVMSLFGSLEKATKHLNALVPSITKFTLPHEFLCVAARMVVLSNIQPSIPWNYVRI